MKKLFAALLLASSLVVVPAHVEAAKPDVVLDLTVASWNVRDLPAHPATIASDFAALKRRQPDIILWQELPPVAPNYVAPLRKTMPGYNHAIARKHDRWYDSPISSRLKLRKATARLFQHGMAGITGNRYITRVRAGVVVLRSAHAVPRAFRPSGYAGPRDDMSHASQLVRQRMWHLGKSILLRGVLRDARAGLPQIVGGDWNRARFSILPRRIAGHTVHVIRHGIDWIHLIDGDHYFWRVIGKPRFLRGHSDHSAIIQHVQLLRR